MFVCVFQCHSCKLDLLFIHTLQRYSLKRILKTTSTLGLINCFATLIIQILMCFPSDYSPPKLFSLKVDQKRQNHLSFGLKRKIVGLLNDNSSLCTCLYKLGNSSHMVIQCSFPKRTLREADNPLQRTTSWHGLNLPSM